MCYDKRNGQICRPQSSHIFCVFITVVDWIHQKPLFPLISEYSEFSNLAFRGLLQDDPFEIAVTSWSTLIISKMKWDSNVSTYLLKNSTYLNIFLSLTWDEFIYSELHSYFPLELLRACWRAAGCRPRGVVVSLSQPNIFADQPQSTHLNNISLQFTWPLNSLDFNPGSRSPRMRHVAYQV